MKSVMSLEIYKKLKLKDLNTTNIPHVVGASGESLGARGRTKCEVNISRRIFYQTFIVCEHLKRPIILGTDFSIQNCIGISWTKTNTRQLTQNNEVIAETAEYQTPSRTSVSLKKNIKIPPRSCAVVDVDINTTEKIKVEVIPDQLWLSANPYICTYPMIADLKEREPNTVTPFVIVNVSHHKHLHLPKDQALFLRRVIKNVRSHDFYSPFYSFLASRYLFRVTICKNYGSFFLGFTFFTLLIFLNYNSLTHF